MSNPNRLTTKEVARICKVSDATVKRWASAGLIKSEKTSGGHRRFRYEDVAKFQSSQGLGEEQDGASNIVTAHKRSGVKKKGASDLFLAMISGSEEEVANIVIKAFLDGRDLSEIFDEMLSAELELVGREWKRGNVSVAEEHLATRCTAYALYKLRTVLPLQEKVNKLALTCAVEGDHHGLATELSRMVLESKGWSVLNFGANTPFFSLKDECLKENPDVICISASMLPDFDRLAADYSSFRSMISKETKVVLGGHGFDDPDTRSRFPADCYPMSFKDLADFIQKHTP